MIEFKQIIGRGTRLFDGKDYFTIYDFVKAYEHFTDPEWDGELVDPFWRVPEVRGEDPTPTGEDEGDGQPEGGEGSASRSPEDQDQARGRQRAGPSST